MHEVMDQAGIAEADYDGIRRGLLYVYRDAASFEAGKHRMKIISDNGRALQTVDAKRIVELEPALGGARSALAGGFYGARRRKRRRAQIRARAGEEMRSALGVEFRNETTVTGLATEKGAVTSVATDKGAIAAGRVVLALGAFSPLLAKIYGIKISVYPVKGYSVTFPIPVGDGGRNAAPAIGCVDENGLVAWCKLGDKLRLTATAEFTGYDTGHKPEDFRVMIATIKTLLPDAADYAKPRLLGLPAPDDARGHADFLRPRRRAVQPVHRHRPGPYGLDHGLRLGAHHRRPHRRPQGPRSTPRA